jgi:putative aldouronate transport system substrate-binding protein
MKRYQRFTVLTWLSAAVLALLVMACNNSGSTRGAQGVAVGNNDGPLTPYSSPVVVRVGYALSSSFRFRQGEDVDNNAWTKLYKDALNIELKSMWNIDESQAITRMNTAVASGDYPDIFTVSLLDYARYAESGIIADVTDLYDNYVTDHGKEWLNSDNGYALGSMRVNGRFYGIPFITNPYDQLNVLWFRQDWLDNLNLPVPKTIDEFIRVADAFTRNDPDGNGLNDTYAIAFDGSDVSAPWGNLGAFFEMFDAYPKPSGYANNLGLVDDGTGSLRWGGETEGMKEALALLNDFYNKGYIAQDFATHDAGKAQAEIVTGRAGMFFGPMYIILGIQGPFQTNIFTGILPKNAALNATPVPGESGYSKVFLSNSYSSVWAISSKHKNPEALFKMFNLAVDTTAFSEDPQKFSLYYGEEDNYWHLSITIGNWPMANYVGYQKVSEAIMTGNPDALNTVQRHDFERILNDYLNAGTVTENNLPNYAAGYGLWSVFANPSGSYAAVDKAIKAGALQPAGYRTGPTETMSSRASSLTDLTATSVIKIIYGEEPPSYWDTVVANWHKIGGDEVLADANKWYKSR